MFSLLTLTRSIYIHCSLIAKLAGKRKGRERERENGTPMKWNYFLFPSTTFPIIFINIAVVFICAHKEPSSKAGLARRKLNALERARGKKLKSFFYQVSMEYFEHIIIVFMPRPLLSCAEWENEGRRLLRFNISRIFIVDSHCFIVFGKLSM